MDSVDFEEVLDQILAVENRYDGEAFFFVREALDYTQKLNIRSNHKRARQHISGQELLVGMRKYALEKYGPMAHFLFTEWGVRCCEDFGEIVFLLIEKNVLAKNENDCLEDFKSGYKFMDAFVLPFYPPSKLRKLNLVSSFPKV